MPVFFDDLVAEVIVVHVLVFVFVSQTALSTNERLTPGMVEAPPTIRPGRTRRLPPGISLCSGGPGWGQIEGGVAFEEAGRLQHEAGVLDRHHREILRTRNVQQANRVPKHYISIDKIALGPYPVGEARPPLVLVDVVAWSVLFGGIECGEPRGRARRRARAS